ncbi:hypothetical protein ACRRTK_019793 [Alexandromys fortis]
MWWELPEGRASRWISPVVFGVQVLLELGWQLEAAVERLQQENPELTQLEEKKNP